MGTNAGFPPNLLGGSPIVGQAKISVTGTAVQLSNVKLLNGVILTNGGTTAVTIGDAAVTATADGTGNGYVLGAGASVSCAVDNLNRIFINGTANTSWISYMGS